MTPGQPGQGVIDAGFSCIACIDPASNGCGYIRQQGFPDPFSGQYCTRRVPTGDLAEIRVIISGDIIRRTTFVLRNDTFNAGELTLLMGERPVLTFYRQCVQMDWIEAGLRAYGRRQGGPVGYGLWIQRVERIRG